MTKKINLKWRSYCVYSYRAHGGGYRSAVFTGPNRNVIVMVTRRYQSKDAAEQAAVDTMRGKRRDEPGWMVGR
jgi:hypothetical protein